MAALSSVSVANVSFSISNPQILRSYRRLPTLFASASATPSHESSSSTQSGSIFSSNSPPKVPFVESPKTPENGFNYALANPNGNPVVRFVQHTESTIERAIFDFRFLAFLAIGGSLAGSLLCFLNGCVYIIDAYRVYWTSCVKGIHTGQMVLRLVEAIDVYLAGTVMFIFGMGLYGLFITNFSANVDPTSDRALKHSSLFGMFALKVVALWIFFSYITIFLFANLNWPYTSTVPLYIVAFFINFSLFFLFDYLRKEIGDGKSDGYLSKGSLLCLEESCLSWNCLHVP